MARLVVFDMDGVLADIESSWVFVHKHFGVNNDQSLYAYLRGEITDLEFIHRDIDLWRKKKLDVVEADIRRILDDVPLMNGAKEAVAELRARGIRTAIVSAGIDLLAERISRQTGIEEHLANGMKTEADGRLTGEGILNVKLTNKGEALRSIARNLGVQQGDCVSVGNSKYDVSMFEASGFGIAFCPEDQVVKDSADAIVDEKDLRSILKHI